MNPIELKLDAQQNGAFVIEEGDQRLAEMAISIEGTDLIVYHTEVVDDLKGKGISSQLLSRMVDYAREHHLKVVPNCPYVYAQFKRHRDKYADVWNKQRVRGDG